MNVLFVTCWYPTDYNPNFGIFVKEHAHALARVGADVKVVHVWPVKSTSIWKTTVNIWTDENGVECCQVLIHSLFYRVIYHAWPVMYRLLRRVAGREILSRFTPDVLHGHTIYPAGFITRKLAGDLETPYYLTEHWTKLPWIFAHPLWKHGAAAVYRDAVEVYPVSGELKSQIRTYTGGEVNLRVVPNIVHEAFGYAASAGGDGTVELLCVMNFFSKKPRHKLPELVARALETLPAEKQARFRIRYVGPGQDGSEIKTTIERLELESEIIFDGLRPKPYIAQKMREADYLVHPTSRETFGVVIAEALTSGLPCIISNNETLKELVNPTNGYVVPHNTAADWAEALQRILDGKLDFDRNEIAGTTGDRFSLERVGTQYMEGYRKCAGTGRPDQ